MKKKIFLFLVLVAVLFIPAISRAGNPAPPQNLAVIDGFLEFPLHNYTPYTAPISAVMDHSVSTGFNCPDDVVVAYTAERGESQYLPLSNWSTAPGIECGTGPNLYGFKNSTGTAFSINGQYIAPDSNGDNLFLFYDGHTGYDYPVPDWTTVKAVADGTVVYDPNLASNDVRIDHPNGFSTYYLHLSSRVVADNQIVSKGSIIGYTGNGHLHLTVKKGTQRVDPYGWKGPLSQDPLQIDGQDNICLWEMCQ